MSTNLVICGIMLALLLLSGCGRHTDKQTLTCLDGKKIYIYREARSGMSFEYPDVIVLEIDGKQRVFLEEERGKYKETKESMLELNAK